jgi:PPM family protein phosphatase
LKLPPQLAVGVCTHAGRVRATNEDDYLLVAAEDGGPFLAAIADGMGGLSGGAEASRTALRALAVAVLDARSTGRPEARLRRGFVAAAVPGLRDMGTTLTAVCLGERRAGLLHIGDCRAYRRSANAFEQLTVDHTSPAPQHLLTRCLGGGAEDSEPDCSELTPRPGDRFVLVSDGVHRVVPPGELRAAAAERSPQAAADALVAAALAHGGPDNATAVVVDVLASSGAGDSDARSLPNEVDLPRGEVDQGLSWPRPRSLRPPIWPWVLLVAAALWLLRALALAAGFDPFARH